MTRSMTPSTTRRHLLAGGAATLLTSLGALRHAGAQTPAGSGPDYAVFTEMSPESKLLKAGWNTRVFTDTDARNGNAIQCDFATGIVTVAPGTYHISGLSIVTYNTGGEPPEMATVRVSCLRRLLPVAARGRDERSTLKTSRTKIPGSNASAAGPPPTWARACSKPI